MPKPELEFQTPNNPWRPVDGPVRGISAQVLAADPDTGDYTRLLRYEPGVDTSAQGARAHDYWEEIYILEGTLTDLQLNQTFSVGMYACRPPGMRHGPWRSERGVLMLEICRHP